MLPYNLIKLIKLTLHPPLIPLDIYLILHGELNSSMFIKSELNLNLNLYIFFGEKTYPDAVLDPPI